MMKQISVLYAIYVPPGRQRLLLDAIRLFAHPQAKHTAHITVRGPYSEYQDPRAWSTLLRGQRIDLGGVGTFFESGRNQNTVFLSANAEAIRMLWYKPDYPGPYNPHLTIYDGGSRAFAEVLRDVMTTKDPHLHFVAGGLEPLVLNNGPRPLRAMYDPSEFVELLHNPPTLAELDAASDDVRMSWIAELAENLTSTLCEAL
jgi:hypothetical protein